MSNPIRALVTGLALALLPAAAVRAQEALAAELAALEARAAAMEAGDIATHNELLGAGNQLQGRIVASPAKGTPEWKALAQRSNALSAGVQKRLREALPPGAPGRHATAAKAQLDAVEAAAEAMAVGDVPGAKKLQADLLAAAATLKNAFGSARQTALFKECEARVGALDQRILARAKAPAAPRAGPPAPASPAPVAAPVAATPAGPAAPGLPPADPDGLDLRVDVAGLSSTELHYWRDFQAWYDEGVAKLRRGDTSRTAETLTGQLHNVSMNPRTEAARAEGAAAVARYAAARDRIQKEAAAAAASKAAKDKADTAEVNRRLGELKAYFGSGFSAKLEPPCDPAAVRAWIGRLKGWEEQRKKGVEMMARIRAEYPGFAEDPLVKQMTYTFERGLAETIARDVEHTVGRVVQSSSSGNGLLPGRIELAERYLAPDMFNADRMADDAWMTQALDELGKGIEAAEALRIFRTEYQGLPADPEAAALAARLGALREEKMGAATSLYEHTRMPTPSTTDASLLAAAREAIVASGTADEEILGLVVHWGPEAYEEKRESSSSAGGDWIRVETWTEQGDKMQATTAQRIKGDTRMVIYDLKFIRVGHPDSPRDRWFCSGSFESRRIKPENLGAPGGE